LARADAVVVLGTDSPDLPLERVERAFEALQTVDVCIGPAEDGGYYLVGCRGRTPPIFDAGVPWGTSEVMAATTARLVEAGAAFTLLDDWYDIDEASDLTRLARSIAEGTELPHTRALLEERGWRTNG
jgi:glycosyltransferase A (GT-A) superfamily protein (DUF2064 family)